MIVPLCRKFRMWCYYIMQRGLITSKQIYNKSMIICNSTSLSMSLIIIPKCNKPIYKTRRRNEQFDCTSSLELNNYQTTNKHTYTVAKKPTYTNNRNNDDEQCD